MSARRSAEARAKMAEKRRQAWARGVYDQPAMIAASVAVVKVTFTPEMDAEFKRLFWLGRDLDVIAHAIGVSRTVLARRKKELGLPSRRHVKGFYRWSMDRYAAVGIAA